MHMFIRKCFKLLTFAKHFLYALTKYLANKKINDNANSNRAWPFFTIRTDVLGNCFFFFFHSQKLFIFCGESYLNCLTMKMKTNKNQKNSRKNAIKKTLFECESIITTSTCIPTPLEKCTLNSSGERQMAK